MAVTGVHQSRNMSETLSDEAGLDRAYTDGKLVGFFGLATSEGCPFTGEQKDLRIAWLDGFAYGAWEGAASSSDPDQEAACGNGSLGAGMDENGRDDRAIADIAIAHLLRLSKCISGAPDWGPELGSALEAAGAFSFLLKIAKPDPGYFSRNETAAVQ
jgi:hypothetical protein